MKKHGQEKTSRGDIAASGLTRPATPAPTRRLTTGRTVQGTVVTYAPETSHRNAPEDPALSHEAYSTGRTDYPT